MAPADAGGTGRVVHRGCAPGAGVAGARALLAEKGSWVGSYLDLATELLSGSSRPRAPDQPATAARSPAACPLTSGTVPRDTPPRGLFPAAAPPEDRCSRGPRVRSAGAPAGRAES